MKPVETLAEVHYKQLLTYLRLMNVKLGLLINFNVPLIKNGIHRIVNNL
jgi:GxxExxY protein